MLKPFQSYIIRIFCLYLLLVLTSDVTSHRCYICGPSHEGFKRNCDQFNSNPQLYEEECEATSKACVTQLQGDIIARNCGEVQINDCKVANRVNYCYCDKNLCNGDNYNNALPSDDEDLLDGSGYEEIENAIIPTDITTSAAASLCNPIIYMASLLLR